MILQAKDMFTQVVGFLNQLEETCNKCKSMEELETNYELQLTALQIMSMLQHNSMLNLFSKLIHSVYTLQYEFRLNCKTFVLFNEDGIIFQDEEFAFISLNQILNPIKYS